MSENINYAKGFRLKTWLKLKPFIKPYFLRLAALMTCMVITAVIDVILPVFLSYAVDNFITPKTTDVILPFALLYFAAISL